MKLREAKRVVKQWAYTTHERICQPFYYVNMAMLIDGKELRALGVAICQPEDEWRPEVGAGIARSKAIAQLVQQVMTLDAIERKRAAMVETERCIDECLADMTRRYETAQAAIKAASPSTVTEPAPAADATQSDQQSEFRQAVKRFMEERAEERYAMIVAEVSCHDEETSERPSGMR